MHFAMSKESVFENEILKASIDMRLQRLLKHVVMATFLSRVPPSIYR